MQMRLYGSLGLLFLILCFGSPALSDHGLLSGSSIQSALSGATASGKTSKGKGYDVDYGADGSLKFSMHDNSFWDRGHWRVEADHYCAKWEKIRKGAENCWRVKHQGGNKYLFEGLDGANDVEAEITK